MSEAATWRAEERFDFVIIGSGPAGQKAAVQAAKAGRKVAVIEREPAVGGACVHHGTIPSKTLRETAMAMEALRSRSAGLLECSATGELRLASLMNRLEVVVQAHERIIDDQLRRNGVTLVHGRARFLSPEIIEVQSIDGTLRHLRAEVVVIASGSRPRTPPHVPIDHQHILDSDSILTLAWLPRSLVILGAGVIATEYASIFSLLGTQVTLVDRAARPVAFLDEELTARLVSALGSRGGQFLAGRQARAVEWDGVDSVVTTLDDGTELRSERLLCALGREANLGNLCVAAAGLLPNERGYLTVDAHCRTAVHHIYAVGDVIGPPSLASAAMEQGRRAALHALGLPVGTSPDHLPGGVYTVPEMASVGLSEEQATARYGSAVVGRAPFNEVARGLIAAIPDGLLKLVADPTGRKLLGVHIVGEGAAELIHVGQVALVSGWEVDQFVDNIFNFPTLAEAYRVAALDLAKRRLRAQAA